MGPTKSEPTQGSVRHVVRYVGRGSATVKKLYFRPGLARAQLYSLWTGSRTELPFYLFFSLNPPKIQKKKQHETRAGPREAGAWPAGPWTWAGPWTKYENFKPGSVRH